jgi:hypothetical protein
MKKLIYTLVAIILLYGALLAQQTQNVLIIIIDGARYTETFGDATHQYIPRIWNQLKPLGTIYTSFYNDGTTETNPGHASILTGTWQAIANNGTELPHKPTVFEYFRKEKSTTQTENYVVLGKDKLNILAYSDYSGYGSAYGASVQTSTSQYDDITTLGNIKSVINSFHPHIMITNLAGTDRAGHDGPWSNYVAKLQRADSIVYELWNYIQNDSIYKNKTTVIITNDHGRHTTDFQSHGDGCEGCRHVATLIIGPNTPPNVIDASTRTQIDIAPTVGNLLKFSTPYADGTVISTATSLDVRLVDSNIPGKIFLSQNYPNPFNPSTAINYSLSFETNVTLKIYDLLGRELATLVNEVQKEGSYQVDFSAEGRSASGGTAVDLPSGVYVYRLQTNTYTESKKMLLMK